MLSLRLFDTLLERCHDVDYWLFFFLDGDDFLPFDLRFDHLTKCPVIAVLQLELVERGRHGIDEAAGQPQLVLVRLEPVDERYLGHPADLVRITEAMEQNAALVGRDEEHIFAISQLHFTDADFAAVPKRRAEQRVRLGRDIAVRAREIRRLEECRVDIGCIHETFDLDDLHTAQLDLIDVVLFKNDVLIRLVLIALDDVLARNGLAALFALLVVANATAAPLVQLAETHPLRGIHRTVDADRDRHQREADVTLPD